MSTAVENVATAVENTAQTAVETITDGLKNTIISGSGQQEAEPVDPNDPDAVAAAENRRLYVGNLAYTTTEEQLKEEFAGFEIEGISIPVNPRTQRAVGYAFLNAKDKETAEKAIQDISGKEILGRKVSVQLAKKPGSGAKEHKKQKEQGENTAAPESPTEKGEGSGKRGRGGLRGRGRRGRGGLKRGSSRKNDDASGEEGTTPVNVPGQVLPLVDTTNKTEGEQSKESPKGPSGFKAQKKKRGPPENGIPSTTKVMVANIPYELTEEKLKELFNDYQPESAKIALRPIPRYMVRKLQARGEARKGRGFGFVTLGSEELQKKAVEEMNGKTVEGREIAVKVAVDSANEDSPIEEKKTEGETQTGEPAASEATPATA